MKPFETIEEAISALPDDSPYRTILAGIWSSESEPRTTAEEALRKLTRPYWEAPVVVPEAIATTVLRAVLEIPAPPPPKYKPGIADVAFSLIGSATPAVLALVRSGYASAGEDLRLSLLTLVASAVTPDGANLFAELVSAHGWMPTHQRLVHELTKNMDHADLLFPALLDAKDPPVHALADLLLGALHDQKLAPEKLAKTALSKELATRLETLTDAVAKEPEKQGELAMLLDFAGYLGGEEAVPRLRKALELPLAWPGVFAITSLLRRGETVPDEAIARVAANAAARRPLYGLLSLHDAASRIPAEHRSRDAFAEADMVEWLSHPGELGQPPSAIEKMAVFDARTNDEDVQLYVWRFKGEDDQWKASVSGPYPTSAPEGPLNGPSTFSRFDAWEKATAEEHAGAVLKTLSEWAAKRD